jgi:ABC-type transporter Mla subunit MlaD
MSNSGLQQLKSLQTKLNQLIDTASNSDVSFPALDEVRSVDDPLERQNPQLAAISATLGQMSAVVGGHRHVLMGALQVRNSFSLSLIGYC